MELKEMMWLDTWLAWMYHYIKTGDDLDDE